MQNPLQTGSSRCNYSAAQGGSLQNQFKHLLTSTKKGVKSIKKKLIGKKKPVKRKSTTTKKKPAKRKTPVKKKSTVTKRKPTKKKPTKKKVVKKKVVKKKVVKKKVVKKKVVKKKVVKKKVVKKKVVKKKNPVKRGGATSMPQAFVSRVPNYHNRVGGNFNVTTANNLNSNIKLMGGGSSDYISTLSSRGPVNYPVGQGTGLGGEQLFRIFNKTGLYMPTTTMNYDSVLTDGILGNKLTGGNSGYKAKR